MSEIWTDPERMGGVPCFRGTRVPVKTMFDYLGAGDPLARFIEHFPTVTEDQARAVLGELGHFLETRADLVAVTE